VLAALCWLPCAGCPVLAALCWPAGPPERPPGVPITWDRSS